MDFHLTVDAREARDRLQSLADRAGDMRPALSDAADVIFDANARLWSSTGYGQWAKAEERESHPLMRKSDALHGALTQRGQSPEALDLENDQVFVGIPAGQSAIYYGRFHQLGEHVPSRRVVAPVEKVRQDVLNAVGSYLVGEDWRQ